MNQSVRSGVVAQELLRLEAHAVLLKEIYRLGVGKCEPSVRLALLFATVLKLLRMVEAVELLAREQFVEEIQSLGRTMAEVTINAAYLQSAEDEEVDRFQHFDTQSAFKHAARLRPHATTKLSAVDLKRIEEVAEKARLLTGRKDADASWSKRTLLQRAEYSDKITRLDIMKLLVLTSYAHGHSAVHGTYDAMDVFISSFNESQMHSQDKREEGLFVAVASVNYSLYIMSF